MRSLTQESGFIWCGRRQLPVGPPVSTCSPSDTALHSRALLPSFGLGTRNRRPSSRVPGATVARKCRSATAARPHHVPRGQCPWRPSGRVSEDLPRWTPAGGGTRGEFEEGAVEPECAMDGAGARPPPIRSPTAPPWPCLPARSGDVQPLPRAESARSSSGARAIHRENGSDFRQTTPDRGRGDQVVEAWIESGKLGRRSRLDLLGGVAGSGRARRQP